MIAIVTIRPEDGARATLARARARGIDVLAFPMFAVEPVSWQAPLADDVDALLVGSANAFRYGGEKLRGFSAKPVYAVGQSTAAAARSAGFVIANVGTGGLQHVVDAIERRPVRLLRIAGRRHVPLDVPDAITVETRVAYEVRELAMPPDLAAILSKGAVAMLHSAAAAQHFRAECERLELDLASIRIAALGPRIAGAAGDGWAVVRAVPQPRGDALLALAADMCH